MPPVGRRSRGLTESEFPDITWEHSHVVTDDAGTIKSFCIYDAPNPEMIREHSVLLGDHHIDHIYEIGGDITPGDFPI